MLNDILIILPELILFIGAMTLLMIGAFRESIHMRYIHGFAILILFCASLPVLNFKGGYATAFQESFIVDQFSQTMKLCIFTVIAIALILSNKFMRREGVARYEYAVLILLASTGMGVMVSANSLITMYLGIELQSLSLYVLAAIHRDSLRSTEAGMKYFVLGALSSGLLLYGCSWIYGFTGTTIFPQISEIVLTQDYETALPHIVGIVFILAGLAFKISAVPFHMWTPDVYEGAPSPVTALFASAPKLAGMALLIRILVDAFPDSQPAWQQIIIFMSIMSMMLGAFAAIGQHNIKRLMAYSSIGHVGYALLGLAAGASVIAVSSTIIYMILYVMMTLATFACILSMRVETGMVERIDDLAGLARRQPFMAFCLAALMFSLAGIPPLAGFFGKFYVLRAAIDAELYSVAVIGVLASVIAAFYYLRIVKIMYLDDAPEDITLLPQSRDLRWIMGGLSIFVILFFIAPSPLIQIAESAAVSLVHFIIP